MDDIAAGHAGGGLKSLGNSVRRGRMTDVEPGRFVPLLGYQRVMAKKSSTDLFDRLRAAGLRKKVARSMSDALGSGRRRAAPPKAVRGVVADLKRVAEELDDRVKGGPQKRSAAAKKAAATRKRNAAKRSAVARKAARTRRVKN